MTNLVLHADATRDSHKMLQGTVVKGHKMLQGTVVSMLINSENRPRMGMWDNRQYLTKNFLLNQGKYGTVNKEF